MEYNSYGNPVDRILDDININDKVVFITHKRDLINNRSVNKEILLEGIWDGEKVIFTDKDHTIVRTTEWLKLTYVQSLIRNYEKKIDSETNIILKDIYTDFILELKQIK